MQSAITELGGDTTVFELRYECECTGCRHFGLTVRYPSDISCWELEIEIICPAKLTQVGDWHIYEGDPRVVPREIPPRGEIDDVLEKEMGRQSDLSWCDHIRSCWAAQRIMDEMAPKA